MIHILKKSNITLSNWIEDGRRNWMKHRLLDYTPPIDLIRITKEYRNLELVWNVYFEGNLEYIKYMFHKIYGNRSYKDAELDTLKKNIDNILSKADKLIIFA